MQKTNSPTHFTGALKRPLLVSVGLALLSYSVAQAFPTWSDIKDNVQVGGFLSQGYLDSTNNNYPVDTKGGTFDFREIALNGSATLGSHLRVGGQLFTQKLGKYGDDKITLDWATADYSFCPEFGVRAGRVKYPRGLQSDVLDLDQIRPFILLPQSNYDDRLRDFQKSFDGGMFYGSVGAGKSTFDYKVFYGKLPMKTDSGVADYFNTSTLFANPPGLSSIKVDSVRGAALIWSTPITGLRFGVNYSELKSLDVVGPFKQVPIFTSEIILPSTKYTNYSIEYSTGPWTFTGEYLLQKGKTQVNLPAALRLPPTTSVFGQKSFYVSAARRLGKKFEVGTYYADERNSYLTTPSPADKRHDTTIALRYDYNDHLLFKIEAHAIRGTRDIFNVPDVQNSAADLKYATTLFAAKTTLSF